MALAYLRPKVFEEEQPGTPVVPPPATSEQGPIRYRVDGPYECRSDGWRRCGRGRGVRVRAGLDMPSTPALVEAGRMAGRREGR